MFKKFRNTCRQICNRLQLVYQVNQILSKKKRRFKWVNLNKGTFTNAGQFQVIIGNDVPIFYNDFTAVSGIEGVSKEAAKSAAKSNQNPVQRVMTTLAEIFTPIIPALIVGD